ncbi:SDR family NAD(P)-dependent oxidoreductase [Salipiger marinus]|uniref:NADP-dependent 3-hydroxy acid dehydrogenase YdfG n=1 Tax=Salipiger marinus TaxID=555512 RepID=A0A1G8IRZ0_9RHOB|nr:SDR family NAD(P)-dependent oxidoreductase [Salipiger marinus]SDI21631.1 NADP-dependent 3-hydroxy acid dehydrogenase YdfG [Salipiger marinus]
MTLLITGANRGVGAALAATFTARGEKVLGTARATPGLLPLDVTDPAAPAALAAQLGDIALDALICNAGVYLDKAEDLDSGYAPEQWAQTFAVNVTGVFLTVQAMLPLLERAPAAKIMIISSQMGSNALAKGNALIYRASKAAALNLGSNLAMALKPRGIAVGTYHPGWVRTGMGGEAADLTPEQSAEGLAARLDALSLDSTGSFQTWDGRTHPF